MKSVAAALLLLAVALGIATAHPGMHKVIFVLLYEIIYSTHTVRMQRVISTLRSSGKYNTVCAWSRNESIVVP